jgi:hypothetical protein
MIAQTVIKEIVAANRRRVSGNELFQVPNRCCHSGLARERHDRLQMIRHQHAQPQCQMQRW